MPTCLHQRLLYWFFLFVSTRMTDFVSSFIINHIHLHKGTKPTSKLELFPLDGFNGLPSLVSSEKWSFYLLEEQDLKMASELTLECFYTPRINLNTKGMGKLEERFWSSIISLYNKYERADCDRANYLGYGTRSLVTSCRSRCDLIKSITF